MCYACAAQDAPSLEQLQAVLQEAVDEVQRATRLWRAERECSNAQLAVDNARAPRLPVPEGQMRGTCPICALDFGPIPLHPAVVAAAAAAATAAAAAAAAAVADE